MFNLEELEKRINLTIKDPYLFYEALTHKSYLYFHPHHLYKHNERLEFLGDAIVEFVVSHYLFTKFSQLSEGEMTLIRASLVNRERLSAVAQELELDKFMFFNDKVNQKGLSTILSDGFEALVAAIFLDNDLDTAYRFVVDQLIVNHLEEIIKNKLYKDPKSRLQEYFQEKFKSLPRYDIIKTEGPEHQKKFYVGLYLEEKLIAVGEGQSKQEAEINAAQKALKKFKLK